MVRAILFSVALLASVSANAGWEEAINSGDVREVKKLLAAGENANVRLSGKKTPLMLAAASGNVYMVNALLAAGADINAKDSDDEGALLYAVRDQHMDLAVRLIAMGADTAGVQLSGDKDLTPPIVVDLQGMKVDRAAFANAATRAFMQRAWFVVKREPNRIVGYIARRNGGVSGLQLYKAEMRFEYPYIVIKFQDGYGTPKPKWLQNLEQSLMIELETGNIKSL